MTLDSVLLEAVSLEPSGHIPVLYTAGIEPILQRRASAVVWKHAAIPESLKRRHLVVACASTRVQGKPGVGANRNCQNRVFFQVVFRDCESVRRRQLVIGIQRRRMACGAAFPMEYPLATLRD